MGINYPWTNGLAKAERVLYEMICGDPLPEPVPISSDEEGDVM
jgi:hypothetical protein